MREELGKEPQPRTSRLGEDTLQVIRTALARRLCRRPTRHRDACRYALKPVPSSGSARFGS